MRPLAQAVAVMLVVAGGSSPASQARPRPRLVESVDVQIPVAPTPVRIAGKPHLVYELHLTNLKATDIVLTRVEIRDAGRRSRLADYRGPELTRRLSRPGARPDLPDRRLVAGGMRAVVNVWLAVDEGAVPARLLHRIELERIGPAARQHAVVEGPATGVRGERPVVLDPPLRGGPWVAVYDPFLIGGHRTAIYTMGGKARIPARYAIDWIKLGADGSRARGDESKVASWHGHGAEVLAVADAVVADARDDVPGADSIGASKGPIALEDASGNYVALDLGSGRHAFYEHLAPGSVRVKPGDRVRRGQVIARLGNTGSSSSGPHLHFHVSDASSTLAAEGLPYELAGFEVVGAYDSIEAAHAGRRWKPAPRPLGGARTRELPAPNVVVRFGPDRPPAPHPVRRPARHGRRAGARAPAASEIPAPLTGQVGASNRFVMNRRLVPGGWHAISPKVR